MRKGDQRLIFIFYLISSLFLFTESANAFGRKSQSESPCPHLRILQADKLDLTDTEIRLLCGDPEQNRVGRAWSDIPITQAKRNFTNFLQDRGYFFPKFREVQPGLMEFDPGEKTHIKNLKGENLPDEVRLDRYRMHKGEELTPKRVSSARDWLKKRFQEEGYPCPEVEAEATPETGEMVFRWLNPSEAAAISAIQEDGTIGLRTGIIRRYDAFRVGQQYSLMRTQITGKRSSADHLTISHDLEPNCRDYLPQSKQIEILETIQVGPPRLITFAVGLNTESIVIGRASWAHTRLGKNGSDVSFTLRGSLKEQSALAKANWYFLNHPSRQSIAPLFRFSHENERRYELIALRGQTLWTTGFEFGQAGFTFGIGPGGRNIQQIDGVGPLHSRFMTIETEMNYLSHAYEYYSDSPRMGQKLSFISTFVPSNIPYVGHPFHARIEGTTLFNPGGYDPPLFVFGVRGGIFFTKISQQTRLVDVPIDFRKWIGGGRDVRGFGREELPDNDFGARAGGFAGAEVRVPHILPAELEPFVFTDGAWLRYGATPNAEGLQGFWSPGFGIRWESPIGALRTSLAHGYEIGKPDSRLSHWQFYLSLGEEF